MFNIDKRILYIIIAIFTVSTIVQYIQNPMELLALLLTLPGVIVAITFHEFAHAFVADKLGDDTPRRQGRLNLNPLSHIDPVGFFMLIFAHFGWGKPVEINPANFNRKRSMSAQEALVALAGPVMNLIIAIVLTIILFTITTFTPTFILSTTGMLIGLTLQMAISVNIGLGVFNLIPLPPLDGSKILMHFLPYNAKTWFENNAQIFYIVFIVLWVTNLISYIISPVINIVSTGIYSMVSALFGIFKL
ncbi:MAG: site-2 protease family protein [Clostridium sp.]|jgi:Zn-dependent protease|nr:MAG: site-2 protease family protein [Clostridium sp.]